PSVPRVAGPRQVSGIPTQWTAPAPMRHDAFAVRHGMQRHLGRRTFLSAAGAAAVWAYWAPASGPAPGEQKLDEVKSPYNHIVVAERGTVRTMYFVVDGTYYIESRWDRSHPTSLDLDYTRTMMAGFLVHPHVRRLLLIGFGGGQI